MNDIDKLRDIKAKLNAGRRRLNELKYDLDDENYAKAVDIFSKKEKEFDKLSRGAFHKDKQLVKGSPEIINTNEEIGRFKNSTDKLSTNDEIGRINKKADFIDKERKLNKVKSGGEFIKDVSDKRAAKKLALKGLKKGGKKFGKKFGMAALGAVPVLGGLASAFHTGDVMAAIPGIGDVIESEALGGEGLSEPRLDEYREQMRRKRIGEAGQAADNDLIKLLAKRKMDK